MRGTVERDRRPLIAHLAARARRRQRSAEGGPVIGRGGLDVDLVEQPRRAELRIRGRVECDASGKGEAAYAEGPPQVTTEVQDGPVETRLQRRGHVFVLATDLCLGVAWRKQLRGQQASRTRVRLTILPGA